MYYVDQTPYHRVTMPEARGAGGAEERTSFVFFAYPEYSTRLSAAGKEQDKGLRRKARVLLGHLAEIDAYNLYAQGEQLFDTQQYTEARAIFLDVQEKYPQSDQAVNAAVNIGASYMAEEEYRKAGDIFQGIVEKYDKETKYQIQVDFAKQQLEVMTEARVL